MLTDLNISDELLMALYKKWAKQSLTASEDQLLADWLAGSPLNQKALQEIQSEDWAKVHLKGWNNQHAEKIWARSREAIPVVAIKGKQRFGYGWIRYAAAILVIAAAGWFWLNTEKKKTIVSQTQETANSGDKIPGSNKAILTLADGSTILLNNAMNGKLANQGNTEIRKDADGQIRYLPTKERKTQRGNSFNTMATPYGGQYQLTLQDGTKVWLNAASSITYPVSFQSDSRSVTVTGEVYFEVAPNAAKPFLVKTGKDVIQVLGTQFNVNSYPDEIGIKTSLVDGSVKVNDQILKPGQAYRNGKVFVSDTNQDIAWKNGIFDFNNVSVEQAMKQLARWYNIKIVYDQPVNEIFLGKIGRGLTLLQVLKTMDGAGVHFKLEGDVLHVFK